jgi:hypothetical protein
MQDGVVSLAAMGCGGRLLQMERDGSLAVTAHRSARAAQWAQSVTGLHNGAEKRLLPYSVQTLRVMSVDELRQVERSMLRKERALQKQVRCNEMFSYCLELIAFFRWRSP